jgi:hypothetical protein
MAWRKAGDFHPGIYALALNSLVAVGGSVFLRKA